MATVNVTNAQTFVSGDEVNPGNLNALGLPTVTVSDIVNADISASAAIAVSKLGSMTAGTVLIGNASNVATATAFSGDVTVTSAGVTAIGSAKVTSAMLAQPMTLMSSQATTSGTSFTFPSIPSWVKRITVMLDQVSTAGTSRVTIRVGAGAAATTGYTSIWGGTDDLYTNGFTLGAYNSAADSRSGLLVIAKITGNTYVATGSFIDGSIVRQIAGRVALGGVLDRVVVTTENGTDAFDAGTVNIMYEG